MQRRTNNHSTTHRLPSTIAEHTTTHRDGRSTYRSVQNAGVCPPPACSHCLKFQDKNHTFRERSGTYYMQQAGTCSNTLMRHRECLGKNRVSVFDYYYCSLLVLLKFSCNHLCEEGWNKNTRFWLKHNFSHDTRHPNKAYRSQTLAHTYPQNLGTHRLTWCAPSAIRGVI